MITQETCAAIYAIHREIKAGEKLLADLMKERERAERNGDHQYAPKLPDLFGRPRGLTLGVPSGENGHQLFDVSPILAESVIRAHIENKRAELVAANEFARMELDS
ncbi:hypothetical protein [Uliginosibacterium sediminicola]|uniref:Uncharacterized protein n=1 Tax=Uliginosibacterium sediminicola TaxID=2024550 RepID=A0ABU9YVV8_9RHOO